jgi:lysophospholipid acyltransferase (LPLAT)-like uncharacterized protein
VSSSKKKKRPPLAARIFFSKPSVTTMSWIANVFLKLLYTTLKIKIENQPLVQEAAKGNLIIALWHDGLLLAPLLLKILPASSFACVVSKSRDGRVLASYVNSLARVRGILVGHHNRHGALLEMIQTQQAGHIIVITPDGPRGPRHVAKDGLTYLAEKAESQIVSMSWQAKSFWQLDTWDKMRIPKPFTSITITFAPGPPSALSTKQDRQDPQRG